MVFQNIFERTYIINLPERLDRKAEIQRELKRIDSSLMAGKIELFPAVKPVDYACFPTRGTLGCYLSHLSILKQARADNLGNVLLLEDDLAISRRFKTLAKELSECLSQVEWDIIFLGFFPYRGSTFKDYYNEQSGVIYSSKAFTLKETSKPTQGTHFYVVNQRIYDEVIDFLEDFLDKRLNDKDLIEDDSELGRLDGAYLDTTYYLFKRCRPEVRSLIVCPNLGWQRNSYSDITTSEIELKMGNKQIFRIYRSMKSGFKKNLEAVNPYWFSR